MPKNRFSFRALTSLLLFWAFLSLVLTGAALYVAPKGRIAHWTDWHLVGLAKEEWAAIHILTAILFLLGGLFHLLKFNRHVIWAYVRRSREEASPFRWAIVGSIAVFAFVLAGTLLDIQPFAAVMDVNTRFREGLLATDTTSPPMPHLEELSLAEVSERIRIEPSEACEILRREGITCDDPAVTLLEIARANDRSPNQVYALLQPAPSGGTPGAAHSAAGGGAHGVGWGRLTVADVAEQLGMTPEQAVTNLHLNGIEAAANDSLRLVADRSGLRPADVPALMSTGGE